MSITITMDNGLFGRMYQVTCMRSKIQTECILDSPSMGMKLHVIQISVTEDGGVYWYTAVYWNIVRYTGI